MKQLPFLLLAVFVSGICAATAIHTTLPQAVKEGAILVSVRSTGGYCTKGLQLEVQNISCKDYVLDVPPALIFRPDDSKYQDLVVTGIPSVELRSETSQSISLQTFCGKSAASSPVSGLRYSFFRQGDSALTRVMRYINAHGFYDYLGQHAVWAMTDDHVVNGVYDPKRPGASKELAAFVAAQKGVSAPGWYHIYQVNNTPGLPVFFPELQKIVVDLEWRGEPARNMRYSVFRADGSVYRRVAGTEHINAGAHRLHTVFQTRKTPPGTYFVRVYDDDNRTWGQQEVHVE